MIVEQRRDFPSLTVTGSRIEDDPQRIRLDTLEDLYVLVAFDPGAGDREGGEVASWLEDTGFKMPSASAHHPGILNRF